MFFCLFFNDKRTEGVQSVSGGLNVPSCRYFVVVAVLFVPGVVVECVTHCGEGKCPEANPEWLFNPALLIWFCTLLVAANSEQTARFGCVPGFVALLGQEMWNIPLGVAESPLGSELCFPWNSHVLNESSSWQERMYRTISLQLISNVYIFLN